MDESQTYIKMLVQAPDIWNSWQYCIGDYVVFRDVGRLDQSFRVRLISHVDNAGTIFLLGDHEFQSYPPHKFYPVPRQDQLWNMLQAITDREAYRWWDTLKVFSWEITVITPEQIMFSYIMQEKFNKAWSGEEWTIKAEVSNVR